MDLIAKRKSLIPDKSRIKFTWFFTLCHKWLWTRSTKYVYFVFFISDVAVFQV